jgi:hypothetical protein
MASSAAVKRVIDCVDGISELILGLIDVSVLSR